MNQALQIILYGAHFIVSIVLIALVVGQTNRHEGLGVAGGGSGAPIRGRAGIEDQLANYTKFVAIAFMVLSFLVYILGLRFNWH